MPNSLWAMKFKLQKIKRQRIIFLNNGDFYV